MKRSIALTVSLWLMLVGSGLVARVADARTLAKAMDSFHRYFDGMMTRYQIVGASVALVQGNQLVDHHRFGLENVETGKRVDEETIFHWASITKTMTGIAIMQLRDRGRLSLDDSLITYIPELATVYNPFGPMSEITVRHLMTHSAGFRNPTWPWRDQAWQPHEPRDWAQLVAMMPYTEIEFKPGSRWSYSNLGVIFLGRIIERLSHDDFEVYMDKNLFKPLKMYASYFDATPHHLLPHKSESYWIEGGARRPALTDVDTGITVSNGGLKCPIPDFVRYLDFLMGSDRERDRYDGLLKRASLEEMFQPVLGIPARVASGDGSSTEGQGLLFVVEDTGGERYIAHSGSQNAYISHFYYQPRRRAAYVVVFNTTHLGDGPSTRELDRQVKEYIFKQIFTLFDPVVRSGGRP